MIYGIYAALIIVAFLTVLNGFLHGAYKAQADVALGVLFVCLVLASFVAAGWKLGVLSIAVAFGAARLTRPLAARAASRLLAVYGGETNATYVGLPPKSLERISIVLGRASDPSKALDDMLKHGDAHDRAEEALLDYCEGQPEIKEVMKAYQVTRNDLMDLYHQLVNAGAGQWACGHLVAASAIAYPEALRYVLDRMDADRSETAYNLIMHFERGRALAQTPDE